MPRMICESASRQLPASVSDLNKDTKVWVAGSILVTVNFKKTYAKAMNAEVVDADPA